MPSTKPRSTPDAPRDRHGGILELAARLVGRRWRRAAGVVGAVVAVAFVPGVTAGMASTKRAPDLVLVSLSGSHASVARGAMLSARFVELNIGDRRAPASTTGFYLSQSRRLGGGAIRLRGVARIRPLRAGGKVSGSARVTVPVSTPPRSYLLIACANDRRTVKERKTGNDCRLAKRRVTVTSGPSGGSSGAGGTGGAGGSGGASGTPHGCVPMRAPTLASADPSCFDGDAAHGIFVSVLGDDRDPGTIAAPKRMLGAGVNAAFALGSKAVYVTKGVYPEVLTVANGVSVYGGYDVTWQRSPANVTKITGNVSAAVAPNGVEAAIASNITTPTRLQLLTLAPPAPTAPGAGSYGLRGIGSAALVLDHVTIHAASGTDGHAGSDGFRGANGGDGGAAGSYGSDGGYAGAGGASRVGHPGGDGGSGGFNGSSGTDGAPGQSTNPDVFGRMGGPGGPGGERGSNPEPGANGLAGDSGTIGTDGAGGTSANAAPGSGFWATDPGHNGQPGSDGHGGGGGGGGGTDDCTDSQDFASPAVGGYGGGGSFGIFLVNSTGARVRDSIVTAANGGAGGTGGHASYPGAGGHGGPGSRGTQGTGLCTAGAAPGGNGGNGGPGGLGGDGGGGAGGPSIAIFGLGPTDTPGTTTNHGQGGLGARGHGGVGANGRAIDYL
jgi:hypothetical protein